MPKDETRSTEQAAIEAGISRATIMRWLKKGRIKASINVPMSGITLHRWTAADIQRLKAAVSEHYEQGRTGRPPKRGNR